MIKATEKEIAVLNQLFLFNGEDAKLGFCTLGAFIDQFAWDLFRETIDELDPNGELDNCEKICFIYKDGEWQKASGQECEDYFHPKGNIE